MLTVVIHTQQEATKIAFCMRWIITLLAKRKTEMFYPI